MTTASRITSPRQVASTYARMRRTGDDHLLRLHWSASGSWTFGAAGGRRVLAAQEGETRITSTNYVQSKRSTWLPTTPSPKGS